MTPRRLPAGLSALKDVTSRRDRRATPRSGPRASSGTRAARPALPVPARSTTSIFRTLRSASRLRTPAKRTAGAGGRPDSAGSSRPTSNRLKSVVPATVDFDPGYAPETIASYARFVAMRDAGTLPASARRRGTRTRSSAMISSNRCGRTCHGSHPPGSRGMPVIGPSGRIGAKGERDRSRDRAELQGSECEKRRRRRVEEAVVFTVDSGGITTTGRSSSSGAIVAGPGDQP